MVDLHMHSTFSDGSDTPEELVSRAVAAGLKAVALTDHDNVRGVPAFLEACRHHGIAGFSGVEISAEVPAGTLHLLGYGIDPRHAELLRNLARMLDGRAWRNEQILKKLNTVGLALTHDEIAAYAGEDVVGRPHFAQAMIARGYVASAQQAFDDYLAKGKPAYVDRFRLAPEAGIALIRAAGGWPVLAHPFTWEARPAALERRVAALKEAGLGGIEAYYPEHSVEQTMDCLRLAKRLGLVVTGGTDYHGASKPELKLGRAHGGFAVPDAVMTDLQAAVGSGAGVSGWVAPASGRRRAAPLQETMVRAQRLTAPLRRAD